MPLPRIDLRTRRLAIRPVARTDLDDLMAINGDPEVTRHLPYPTWQSPADAQAWLDRMAALAESGGTRQLVLVRRDDQRVIGTVLLFNDDAASRRVELGYVVGRAHWRQGYAREAVAALLDHLFGVLAYRRVEAEVNPDNAASVALLNALGFTCEGHLRERYAARGEVYGVNVYGLFTREWENAHG